MLSIIMPAYRRGTPEEGRTVWGDLRVCMMAIEAYALDLVDEIVVAWEGPWAPDGMPNNPKFRFIERPPGMDMAKAWEWAIEQSNSDEIIHMADDVVLHPDTIRTLLDDVAFVRETQPGTRVGMMAARSNFIAGAQNIRSANNGVLDGIRYNSETNIIQTDRIYTVCVWYERSTWEHVGRFPDGLIWWGDMLFSYDLRQLGYSLFISRAYVHHVGMRGSISSGENATSLHVDAMYWLSQHRPDFLEFGLQTGLIPRELLPADIALGVR